MQRAAAAVRPRALSAATALVFGGGLALYQMSSLVLGPPTTRQLHLSLSIPALDQADRPEPVVSSTTIELGFLAPAVRLGSPAGRTATPSDRNASTGTATPAPSWLPTPTVTVAPVPSTAPRRSDHRRPAVVPSPPPPKDHEPD